MGCGCKKGGAWFAPAINKNRTPTAGSLVDELLMRNINIHQRNLSGLPESSKRIPTSTLPLESRYAPLDSLAKEVEEEEDVQEEEEKNSPWDNAATLEQTPTQDQLDTKEKQVLPPPQNKDSLEYKLYEANLEKNLLQHTALASRELATSTSNIALTKKAYNEAVAFYKAQIIFDGPRSHSKTVPL